MGWVSEARAAWLRNFDSSAARSEARNPPRTINSGLKMVIMVPRAVPRALDLAIDLLLGLMNECRDDREIVSAQSPEV